MENENVFLEHHGILGQKWGVRRYQNKNGSLTPTGKRRLKIVDTNYDEKKNNKSYSSKKSSIENLTDDELRARITRLNLEKSYKSLVNEKNKVKESKGKRFVMDVLDRSGKTVATQVATYAMGSAVNNLTGKNIVNLNSGKKKK